ncbi:LysR substrate-binding domain-containing protein [Methylobacterium sp. J-030]|uniref:LysR family transcriptional regulator n=1 Tax=Methylobacterium sp. J-030 TaxID=2836627 RepID=UPI001FBBA20A|nr:LysR family transcriptional regulator [Methylobacterium sp. J-030]MCJ2072429.1 LysR substrate-binding domain-containing protein [Methylobacterium sp. J-030]
MEELPDLTVKQLRAVVTLSKSGKFTAAAAELGISQPGLSRLIQQAEELLGVALFIRGTRAVAQTEAGRAFIPAAEKTLDELLQQVRNVRTLDGELRGQIVIASLMSISHHVLPTALAEFRTRYPKMHIRIREGLQSGVLEDVRSGVADFGVGSPPTTQHGIDVRSAVDESCYAILPRSHSLARSSAVTLRDLVSDTFVSMPTDSGLRRLVDAAAAQQGVTLDHCIVINQYQSLFDFVTNGLGVSVVPASALSPSREPALGVCRLRPQIRRRVGILHRAERPLSASSEEFLRIFQPMFVEATERRFGGRP